MRRLHEWKQTTTTKATTSQATISNQINYKEKFELILTYILKNFDNLWYTEEAAHEVTEDVNSVNLDVIYDDGRMEYYLWIGINKNTGDWSLDLDGGPCGQYDRKVIEQVNGNGYDSLLDKLLKLKIIKVKKLFESKKENNSKRDLNLKLYEEFKLYENLWDDTEDTPAEKEASSEFARLKSTPEGRKYLKSLSASERWRLEKEYISTTPSYKLVSSYYKITLEYDDYNYGADAHDVFDAVYELLDSEKNLAKISNKELVNEYNALVQAWENAAPEDELKTLEAIDYFVADNLDELVSELYDDVLERFDEQAADWAKDVGLYHWDD